MTRTALMKITGVREVVSESGIKREIPEFVANQRAPDLSRYAALTPPFASPSAAVYRLIEPVVGSKRSTPLLVPRYIRPKLSSAMQQTWLLDSPLATPYDRSRG